MLRKGDWDIGYLIEITRANYMNRAFLDFIRPSAFSRDWPSAVSRDWPSAVSRDWPSAVSRDWPSAVSRDWPSAVSRK